MTRQPTPQNQRPTESLTADHRAILEHAAAYGEPRDDFGLRLLRKAQALSAEWDRFWQAVIAEDSRRSLAGFDAHMRETELQRDADNYRKRGIS